MYVAAAFVVVVGLALLVPGLTGVYRSLKADIPRSVVRVFGLEINVSEALVVTVLGLVIVVGAFPASNWLESNMDRIVGGDTPSAGPLTPSVSPSTTASALPDPDESGRISGLKDGAKVTSPIAVLQGWANIKAGRSAWILIRPNNNRFYTVTNSPAPLALESGGRWLVRYVGVGTGHNDIGKRYELFLVSAPAKESEILQGLRRRPQGKHAAELLEFPRDAVALDRVSIRLAAVD